MRLSAISCSGIARHSSRTVTIESTDALAAELTRTQAAGRPVLLDFTADWCVSCKTIEREVFDDPVVRRTLAGVEACART